MIRTLFLSLNTQKPDADSVAHKVSKLAKKYDMKIVESPKSADCIITIGGDGTYLYGSRIALEHNIALAGINLGRFGFLPSFSPDNLTQLFNALKNTEPHLRSVIDLDVSIGKFHAINEVVIERKRVERAARVTMISSPPIYGTLQREISAESKDERRDFLKKQMDDVISEYSVYADDKKHAEKGSTFVCDGVIVATPLGSTAYSSSAGGPAISPYLNAMSVTFSALHHPRIPPVVLTNNENVYVRVEEECVIVVDGRHVGDIPSGETIRVCVGSSGISVFERPASVLSKLSHAFGADHLI